MNNQIREITSVDNQTIKDAIKLKETKHQRKEQKVLVEGWNIVLEAIKMGIALQVFCVEEEVGRLQGVKNLVVVTEDVARKLSDVETSQNVFAVVQIGTPELALNDNILILDNVQDPGNLGTLIRSAAAFGFNNVVLGHGTVSPYNPKVIRSAQGLVFQVNILQENLLTFIPTLKNHEIYMTALKKTSVSYREVWPSKPVALVLGNEGVGISEQLLALPHQNIIIPTDSKVESLNVAMAGAIIMSNFSQL